MCEKDVGVDGGCKELQFTTFVGCIQCIVVYNVFTHLKLYNQLIVRIFRGGLTLFIREKVPGSPCLHVTLKIATNKEIRKWHIIFQCDEK